MASFDNNAFDIIDRALSWLGVPFIRSGSKFGASANTALDIGPRGRPSVHQDAGLVWVDICTTDLIQYPGDPVNVFRLAAFPDRMAIRTTQYNGGDIVPIEFSIGSKKVMRITADGIEIFGKIKAQSFEGGALPEPEPEPELPTPGMDVYSGGGFFTTKPCPIIGTGDFTIDWHMDDATQTARVDAVALDGAYTGAGWFGALFNHPAAGKLSWLEGTTSRFTHTVPFNDGNLHHCAVVRKNGQLRFYFDGQPQGAAVASSYAYGTTGRDLRVGTPAYAGGGSYVGKLGGPRVTLSALWDGAFTPPSPTA